MRKLLLSFFRRKENAGSGFHINPKLVTFLVCVCLASFFWFVITFNKEYTSTIIFPVEYNNMPKGKVLLNHLPKNIEVDINTSGFVILYYKFKKVIKPIKVDLKEAKAFKGQLGYYIAINNKLEKLGRQFENKIRFLKVNPDTLYISYSKRASKVVPIKLVSDLTYNKEYSLNDSIQLIPNKVTISGPEERINKIKFAETELLKLEDIDKTTTVDLKLKWAADTSIIKVASTDVKAKISVSKYTEGTLDIPLNIDNLPKGYVLKTFPDKITVRYTVPFDDYEKIDEHAFRLRVDYAKKNSNKKLKVEVMKKPANMRSFKIQPEKVEYIIRK